MAGLYFESGIDDGFEKDLNKLNKKLNEFASNTARQSQHIADSAQNGFGFTVGTSKRFDSLGNAINDSMARGTTAVEHFAGNSAKQMGTFERSLSSVGGMLAGYFGTQQLISFGKEVINTIAKFEKYGIVLENTLGSKSKAQTALQMVKDFAASTPFSVDELTDSFIRLTNQGFQPTKEEMTKLGDLASSTGKDFSQLAEAIIDAQTGEFERLKEFGVKAKKEGDNLTFTFKGQTTAVENNAEAIRKYVLSLGELQGVAGANAKIADSLTGQISNLGDTWDNFMLSLEGGNSIISRVVKGFISLISAVVNVQSILNNADTGIEFFKSYLGGNEKIQAALQKQSLIISKITDEKAKENYINNEIIRTTTAMKMAEIALNTGKEKGGSISKARQIQLKLELQVYQKLIDQLNGFKEADRPVFKPVNPLTEKEKKELADAYDKSIKDFSSYLSTQEKAYQSFLKDSEGLSGQRKQIVSNEYSSLLKDGETYLSFLNNLLAKETDLNKKEIIKKEISLTTSNNTIQDQRVKEEQLNKDKKALDELLATYATYTDKRTKIEEKGKADIKRLTEAKAYEQAALVEKETQNQLDLLDQSILKSNSLYQTWIDQSLPAIIANGVSAIQTELNTLQVQVDTGNLSPEQVVVYKAKIEELNKALIDKNGIEKTSANQWKDALELMNGVNDLAKDLISSFDGLSESTKAVLGSIVNISSGIINVVTGFKAVGAAASGIEKASAILAVISAGIKVVTAVVGIFTKKRKERIEAEKAELEALRQKYEEFGNSISSIFGSTASDVAKAFQVMYEGGTDAMKSLEGSFSDMIENFTQQTIQAAFLQPFIEKMNAQSKELGIKFAKGEINVNQLQEGVLNSLGDFYNTLKTVQPQILQAYKNADNLAAGLGFDSAFNADTSKTQPATTETPTPAQTNVSQVQQTISQESESMLVGRLGALMLSNEKLVTFGQDSLDYAIQNLLILKQIKTNTDYLPEIADNTRKTYQKLEAI